MPVGHMTLLRVRVGPVVLQLFLCGLIVLCLVPPLLKVLGEAQLGVVLWGRGVGTRAHVGAGTANQVPCRLVQLLWRHVGGLLDLALKHPRVHKGLEAFRLQHLQQSTRNSLLGSMGIYYGHNTNIALHKKIHQN